VEHDLTDDLEDASARYGLPHPIQFVARTESTNSLLRAAADRGALHGTALVADAQTAGRGRLGRTWVSPAGANLYLSVVLRPELPLARVALVVLAAGVATVESCGAPCRLKWPNDVLDPGGRKIAGILAEAESSRGRLEFVVVGVGINVTVAPPEAPLAGTLEGALGRAVDRADLAARLVFSLLRRVEQVREDPAGLLQAWRNWDGTIGRRVRVGAVEGTAVGIGPDGALEVRDDAGHPHRILAGDVEMIRISDRKPGSGP
jgi:BirA family biotin operon repressor/biotin-[acetyl-CoA-carboxylase] ligase